MRFDAVSNRSHQNLFVLVSIVAATLWVRSLLQRRAESFSPGSSSSVDASRTSMDGSSRVDPAEAPSLAGSMPQATPIPKVLSEADRQRVDVEIQKVRDLMQEMERRNSQAINVGGGRKAYKLQPLTEDQLDLMYNALTRAANTFASGSTGEREFRDEARSLINEFQDKTARDTSGKLTILLGASGDQTPSLMIFSDDAVITERPDGVHITATRSTFNGFKDWNDPDSKSRHRYGHLLEGR
jgi:hypothetical protein